MKRSKAWLLALAWLVPAAAGERVYFTLDDNDDLYLGAYSRAVKLPPLDPAKGNQVRAWFMGYWSGRMPITGYVLSAQGARRCKLSYNNDNGEFIVINPGHCSGPRAYPERLEAAMATLPELAALDGQTIECGTMDGRGALLEGIYDGKRFRLEAQNVWSCEGESYRNVAAMLDSISGAYYEKDPD